MQIQSKIIEAINDELHDSEKSPFTEEGFDQYLKDITDFTVLLFRKSKYFADKQNLEVISNMHVLRASESIHKAEDSKVISLINSIGGILLGCALSILATLITTNSPITTPYMIVMLVTAIVGAFLLGIYLIK